MRKKVVKSAKGVAATAAKIITFDDPESNIHLFDPQFSSHSSPSAVSKALKVLSLSCTESSSVVLASNQIESRVKAIAMHKYIKLTPSDSVRWVDDSYSLPSDFQTYFSPIITSAHTLRPHL